MHVLAAFLVLQTTPGNCIYDNQAIGIQGSFDVSMLGKYTFRSTCGSVTDYRTTPPTVLTGGCCGAFRLHSPPI